MQLTVQERISASSMQFVFMEDSSLVSNCMNIILPAMQAYIPCSHNQEAFSLSFILHVRNMNLLKSCFIVHVL